MRGYALHQEVSMVVACEQPHDEVMMTARDDASVFATNNEQQTGHAVAREPSVAVEDRSQDDEVNSSS